MSILDALKKKADAVKEDARTKLKTAEGVLLRANEAMKAKEYEAMKQRLAKPTLEQFGSPPVSSLWQQNGGVSIGTVPPAAWQQQYPQAGQAMSGFEVRQALDPVNQLMPQPGGVGIGQPVPDDSIGVNRKIAVRDSREVKKSGYTGGSGENDKAPGMIEAGRLKAKAILQKPVPKNWMTDGIFKTERYLSEGLPGQMQAWGGKLRQAGDFFAAGHMPESRLADWKEEKFGRGPITKASDRVQAGVMYGLAGTLETLGQAMIDLDERPVKAAGEFAFGALMATPAGMAFTGALDQPEVRKTTEKVFTNWEDLKRNTAKKLGIKNVHVEDAFSLVADVATFYLAGKAAQKSVKAATTKQVKVGKAEVVAAVAEVFGAGKSVRLKGADGRVAKPPRPEAMAAVKEILKTGDGEYVRSVIENGFTLTRPRESWAKFVQLADDSLGRLKAGKLGLSVEDVGKGKGKPEDSAGFRENRLINKYDPEQKEMRAVHNVTFNEKQAAMIRKDDEGSMIIYEKGNRKTGAVHIKKHIGEGKLGEITPEEASQIGKIIRQGTINPLADKQDGGAISRVYELEEDGKIHKVVVLQKGNSTGEKIITYRKDEVITKEAARTLGQPTASSQLILSDNGSASQKNHIPRRINTEGLRKFLHYQKDGGTLGAISERVQELKKESPFRAALKHEGNLKLHLKALPETVLQKAVREETDLYFIHEGSKAKLRIGDYIFLKNKTDTAYKLIEVESTKVKAFKGGRSYTIPLSKIGGVFRLYPHKGEINGESVDPVTGEILPSAVRQEDKATGNDEGIYSPTRQTQEALDFEGEAREKEIALAEKRAKNAKTVKGLGASRWLNFRAGFDDSMIILREIRNLPGVQTVGFDDPYVAEQLKHGRLDERVRLAADEVIDLAKDLKAAGKAEGLSFGKAERLLQRDMYMRAVRAEQIKPESVAAEIVQMEPVSPAIVGIGSRLLEWHRGTTDLLHEAGIISLFEKNERYKRRYEIAFGEKGKKGVMMPTDVLTKAFHERVAALAMIEANRVRKELYDLLTNSSNSEIFGDIYREVKETDLAAYLERVLKEKQRERAMLRRQERAGAMVKDLEQKTAAVAEKADLVEITTRNNLVEKRGKEEMEEESVPMDADAIRKRLLDEAGMTEAEAAEMRAREGEMEGELDDRFARELKIRQDKVAARRAEIEAAMQRNTLFAEDAGSLRAEVLNWLWVKHAPDYNKKHGDGAAGITTAKARAEARRISSLKQAAQIKSYGKEIKSWWEENLRLLEKEGLISIDERVAMQKLYPKHVPMQREPFAVGRTAEVTNLEIYDGEPPVYRGKGSDLSLNDLLDNLETNLKRSHKLAVQKKNLEAVERELIDQKLKNLTRELAEAEGLNEKAITQLKELTGQLERLGGRKITDAEIKKAAADSKADFLEKETARLKKAKADTEEGIKRRQELIARKTEDIALMKEERKALLRKLKEKKMVFLRVKEKGQLKALEITEPAIARAVNNVDAREVPALLLAENYAAAVGKQAFQLTEGGTRVIAKLAVPLNPSFFLGNLPRDVQTLILNYAASDGFAAAKDAAAKLPASYLAVVDYMVGRDTPQAAKYKRFLLAGGGTGGWAMNILKKQGSDFRKELEMKLTKAGKGKHMVTYLEENLRVLAEVFENGTRFAAFEEAISKGKSDREAAFIAKNITVNFNKKGTWFQHVSALYLFANPALQGTKNYLGRAVNADGSINKNFLKSAAVLAGLVILIRAINDIWDEDWRLKTNAFEQENNFLMVLPGGKDDEFAALKVPMSYEIGFLAATAGVLYDAARGKTGAAAGVSMISAATTGALNVLGQTGSALQTITPTFWRPLVQWHENVSWNGEAIVPSGKGFLHERYRKSTAETTSGKAFIALSQFLYDQTGWDTSPEQWKNTVEQYGSGFARTLLKITNLAGSAGNAEADEMPFIDRFITVRSGDELTQLMEKNRKEAERQEREGIMGIMPFGDWEIFRHKDYAVVVRVKDGDTIEVLLEGDVGKTVRMYGADTPESVESDGVIERGGIEAAVYTKSRLTPGTKVKLYQEGEDDEDRYGRILRVIEVAGGEKLHETLIREGLAYVSPYSDDDSDLTSLEELAKRDKKGIWAKEGRQLSRGELEMMLKTIGRQKAEEKDYASLPPEQRTEVQMRVGQRVVKEAITKKMGELKKLQEEEGEINRLAAVAKAGEIKELIAIIGTDAYARDLTDYEKDLKDQWKYLEAREKHGAPALLKMYMDRNSKDLRKEYPALSDKQIVAQVLKVQLEKGKITAEEAKEFLGMTRLPNQDKIVAAAQDGDKKEWERVLLGLGK